MLLQTMDALKNRDSDKEAVEDDDEAEKGAPKEQPLKKRGRPAGTKSKKVTKKKPTPKKSKKGRAVVQSEPWSDCRYNHFILSGMCM